MEIDFAKVWERALTFDQFVALARPQHRPLWEGIYRNAKAPEWAAMAVDGRTLNLLAITEDWCIDTSSTVPFIARVAETVPGVHLRLILRDANPEIMDRYLTNGARSIPVVIVLDSNFRELQAWVLANKGKIPTAEQVKEERRWYARDTGETTIREVLTTGEWPVPPLPPPEQDD